ncbi:NACHT domain-containing protein [Streptomyces sp. NPDC001832]|uniref:NACHT domain-containing protein n=1 Tax=Streptomyces sp. NPDC001832 TaxID=3154527 RepID=UPI003321A830
MLTGLGVALASACGPAAGRAAGGAAAKLAAAPIAGLAARWKNRKTRRALTEVTYDALCPHLTPESAKQIAELLETPDFQAIALSIATQVYANAGAKNERKELDSTLERLRQLVALRVSDEYLTAEVTQAVWNALLEKTTSQVETVKSSDTFSPESRASMLKIAACHAAADAKSAEQLATLSSLAAYHDFEVQLADQIKNLHSTMRLPHAGTTRKVPYSKLFVEPKLRSATKKNESHNAYVRDLDEVIANHHRVVILGDPGGGKSTLSLKLAYDIARSSFPASAARIPLLFVLRDYVEAFRASKDSMVTFLESICRNPYNVEPPEGAIEYLLSSGRALVIFDGLDELTDTSLRRKVSEFVESFVYRYPSAPVLVTSRRVGYSEAPLDESLFAAVTLAELSDSQVATYAEKWFALDQTVERKRRSELATAFVRESQFVADLRKNPLMLSLMCGIYATEHYIPSNRPDLYQKCAQLLFERWDKQRGIVIPLPFNAHVRQALNALALRMYSDPKAQKGLTRARLVSFMTEFLVEKRFDDEAIAEDAANQFVDFCTGRAWVLTDMGSDTQQNLYAFTHRTFLEYFAATQIVRKHYTPEKLFDVLHGRISAQEWEVVAQLSLQILSQNVDDGGDDFLELILSAIQDTDSLSQKVNLASFAARSLGFMVPRPQIIQSICEQAVFLSLESISDSAFNFEAIALLMECSPENLEMVSKNLKEALRVSVARYPEDDKALLTALFFNELANYTTAYANPLPSGSVEVWGGVKNDLRKELAPLISRHYGSAFWAARLGAVSGNVSMSALIEKFGTSQLWAFRNSYWAAAIPPFVFHASFREGVSFIDSSDFFGISASADCVKALAELLPAAPCPWVSEAEISHHLLLPILRACDGPVSGKSGPLKEGSILMFLPIAELLISRPGVIRHRQDNKVSAVTRTDGKMRRVVIKWARARMNPEERPSAMATLRGLNFSPDVSEFITRWIKGDIDTARAANVAPDPKQPPEDASI